MNGEWNMVRQNFRQYFTSQEPSADEHLSFYWVMYVLCLLMSTYLIPCLEFQEKTQSPKV